MNFQQYYYKLGYKQQLEKNAAMEKEATMMAVGRAASALGKSFGNMAGKAGKFMSAPFRKARLSGKMRASASTNQSRANFPRLVTGPNSYNKIKAAPGLASKRQMQQGALRSGQPMMKSPDMMNPKQLYRSGMGKGWK